MERKGKEKAADNKLRIFVGWPAKVIIANRPYDSPQCQRAKRKRRKK